MASLCSVRSSSPLYEYYSGVSSTHFCSGYVPSSSPLYLVMGASLSGWGALYVHYFIAHLTIARCLPLYHCSVLQVAMNPKTTPWVLGTYVRLRLPQASLYGIMVPSPQQIL